MIEYTWEILSLYTAPQENGLNDVVKKVNWRFQVTDGSYYGDSYEVTELTSPSPDNYIKYQDLTEETIIEWVKHNRDYDSLVDLVHSRLEENKNPQLVEKNTPWNYSSFLNGSEEFMLVFDDNLTPSNMFGPFAWNSTLINDKIKQYGIKNISVPDNMIIFRKGLLPLNNPLIVNDSIKVYKVEYETQQSFDDRFQIQNNLQWTVNNGILLGAHSVVNKKIVDIKTKLREIVKENRNKKMLNPVEFMLNGTKIKTYTDVQTYLLTVNKIQLMSDSEIVKWKLVDSWIDADKITLTAVAQQIDQKMQDYFKEEYDINLTIDSIQSLEELKLYYINLEESNV